MEGRSDIEAVKNCTHTLVIHPVGYHYDVFGGGILDGIENKVLVKAEGKGKKKDGSLKDMLKMVCVDWHTL